MKRSEIIDYIKSFAVKFTFGNLASYETLPVTADLISTDIPAWGNIASLVPSTKPPVITAGTSIPFFVDISLYVTASADSDVITKATAYDPSTGAATGQLKRWYDIDVIDQDSNGDGTGVFTGWNIYGHDDGSGNFKEDTYIILKG